MLYRIQNFGPPKDVIVDGVKYFLGRNKRIDTDNHKFAAEAAKLPRVDVTELLEEINYFELRKIAKERGLEVKRNIRKNELVELLKRG